MRNQHGDFIWYELLTKDPGAAKRFYVIYVPFRRVPCVPSCSF